MTLEKYTKEELVEVSMVEIAFEILSEEKKAMNFNEVFEIIAEAKGFTQQEKEEYIVQFYTDLNIDGRFMSVGSNIWGLKRWYPYDQQEDDTISFTEEKPKKKKKKSKKKSNEAIQEDDFIDDAVDEDERDDEEDEDVDDGLFDEIDDDDDTEELEDEYGEEDL